MRLSETYTVVEAIASSADNACNPVYAFLIASIDMLEAWHIRIRTNARHAKSLYG
jgi:hypothetical protein